MDCLSMREREIVIDIESSVEISKEVGTSALSDDNIGNMVSFAMSGMPLSVDEIVETENSASLLKNAGELSSESRKNSKREKRKSTSVKKHPRPPRPPRGLSLDAADQKLIKEISELAMIKRARIERMKALKKMKASKTSSSPTSSSGNLIAMAFTVMFCIVIILQGCHSSVNSPTNRLMIAIPGSLESSSGVGEGNITALQDQQQNLFNGGVPLTGDESTNLIMELVPGLDSTDETEKASR